MTDKTTAKIKLLSKQKEFIQSTTKETLFTGGWRSGKSLALCFAAFIEAQKPNNRILLARKTHKSLMDTTFKDFRKFIPPSTYNYKKQESVLHMESGSEIILAGLDDFHKIRSMTLGSIFIDEAIDLTENDYDELLYGRLSLDVGNRQIYLASNPATPSHWMYKRFFANESKKRKVIISTPYDNPFLTKDYIIALDDLKELDPQKYNRMVLGKWAAYDDAVFSNFDRAKHVKNTNTLYKHVAWDKILIGFDFGQKHPSGILVAGKYGDQIVILEEFRKSMCLLDVLKKQIDGWCDKYKEFGRATIFYDPSCLLIANELQNMGLNVEKADNTVDMGIAKVRSMLSKDELIIDESCVKLISELENYRYIEGTEKPVKEEDDLVDPLRYICQSSSSKPSASKASIISLDDDTDDDTF